MTAHSAAAIRPLTAADAPAYKALRDEMLRCAPTAFTSDYAESLPRPASSFVSRFGAPSSGQFFLGAFAPDGELVGCIGCDRPVGAKERHRALVVSVMVAPHAQRQGWGRQLLAACIATAARAPGLEQLLLTVTADNPHALRMYQDAGFCIWGRQPGAIKVDGVGYDKIHLQRLLPFSE